MESGILLRQEVPAHSLEYSLFEIIARINVASILQFGARETRLDRPSVEAIEPGFRVFPAVIGRQKATFSLNGDIGAVAVLSDYFLPVFIAGDLRLAFVASTALLDDRRRATMPIGFRTDGTCADDRANKDNPGETQTCLSR